MIMQLELFEQTLPDKPYCTSDLSYGLKIRTKSIAVKERYIQPNKPTSVNWVVLDLDKPNNQDSKDFWDIIAWTNLPTPNLVTFNPENQRCHIFYSLLTPVYTCQMARIKPLRYLASIEYALKKAWEADHSYSGLISKNPLHKHWETINFRGESWELGELSDWLILPEKLPRVAKNQGLGRNCTLFDTVRYWAYDHILEFRLSAGYETWLEAVKQSAIAFNSFNEPLPVGEVLNTAKSIAKWTWANYTKKWTDEEFSAIQSERGKRGGQKSKRGMSKENEKKRAEAVLMNSYGIKQKEIAEQLGITERTLRNWFKSEH